MTSEWRLLDLDGMDSHEIQCIYEVISEFVGKGQVPNTLVLCYPARPYVCVGYHQEVWKEVDQEECRKKGYDIVRRPAGGGTVFLDDGQQFYHVIVSKTDPDLPKELSRIFEKYLAPTVQVYRDLGINAEYKPVNDVVVGGKKISGNGAGSIGDAMFIIGNLIMEMDAHKFISTMKVPSEKFRDKMAKTMEEYMTSIRKENGDVPARADLKRMYLKAFEALLSVKLKPGELTSEERCRLDGIVAERRSDDWALVRERDHMRLIELVRSKCTKVAGGQMICEATYKAGKMLRITLLSRDDVIEEVLISGDFFINPRTALDSLEQGLIGTRLEMSELEARVDALFKAMNVDVPGLSATDLAMALMEARKNVP